MEKSTSVIIFFCLHCDMLPTINFEEKSKSIMYLNGHKVITNNHILPGQVWGDIGVKWNHVAIGLMEIKLLNKDEIEFCQ